MWKFELQFWQCQNFFDWVMYNFNAYNLRKLSNITPISKCVPWFTLNLTKSNIDQFPVAWFSEFRKISVAQNCHESNKGSQTNKYKSHTYYMAGKMMTMSKRYESSRCECPSHFDSKRGSNSDVRKSHVSLTFCTIIGKIHRQKSEQCQEFLLLWWFCLIFHHHHHQNIISHRLERERL